MRTHHRRNFDWRVFPPRGPFFLPAIPRTVLPVTWKKLPLFLSGKLLLQSRGRFDSFYLQINLSNFIWYENERNWCFISSNASLLTYLQEFLKQIQIQMKTNTKISITSITREPFKSTQSFSRIPNVNRHFCVPDFTFITPSNLLTPSVSKSHRRKHHKRTIRFRGGKIRMSDGRRRRRRLEEWAERGEERERERREEGWRRRGKRGDGRDVSWRPTLRGKRSGLPGVPWETDRRRRKRVSPEEDEGLARRSCLLDPPQRIPCSVFSLSLSLSSLGQGRNHSFRRVKPPLLATRQGI